MKAARQAIRSQAALDHAERELGHAEATIQELRTKLHHAHREKDAALESARLATTAKFASQRSILEAEASRDHRDRALREALAANRDLQAQLDALARGFDTAKAQRPRKTPATAPAPASNNTGRKAMESDEITAETAGNLQKKAQNRQAAGQEPVQWWVERWKGRRL